MACVTARHPSGIDVAGQLVNGSSRWLKAQVFCLMPEQVLSASGSPNGRLAVGWLGSTGAGGVLRHG